MSSVFSSLLLAAADGIFSILKSVRLRASASAYLNRTMSASNRKTFTLSWWMKRTLAGGSVVFCAGDAGGPTNSFIVDFNSDSLRILNYSGGSLVHSWTTTQVFRDPSAWYHFVMAVDTTQATANNRVRLYVNGSEVTAFTRTSTISQNADTAWNGAWGHYIGRLDYTAVGYPDIYLAEVNGIDGQQLTPSSFGSFDLNGVWQPARYSASYGTNGFYLTFNSNSTSAALGTDSSGNGLTWTVNNVSVTAGSTYDSMTDSPTVTSSSVANYAVMNPLQKSLVALTNGNLQVDGSTGSGQIVLGTMSLPTSGKYYWEITTTNAFQSTVGVGTVGSFTAGFFSDAGSTQYYYSGSVYIDGSIVSTASSYTNGDVIGVAFDATTGKVYYSKNGTWQNSAVPSSGTGYYGPVTLGKTWFPGVGSNGTSTFSHAVNFGQRPFTYTPPTGFNALNTYNLPTPTIANGAQYMAATLYTGNAPTVHPINNGINNTIGTTFQPDFVWMKSRSSAINHTLYDVLRGTSEVLISNSTAAGANSNSDFTSFNSNGFTVATESVVSSPNGNGQSIVAWQWKANGTGVSNTNGSITSTVSANTTAGFSVVTYTGNGTNGATIGHGLGVAPNMVLFKPRNTAQGWDVYHSSVGATAALALNSTGAAFTSSVFFNNTAPTSSVITLGTDTSTNTNGTTMVAYCFAAVPGYSAFGSYTGNGSTDGPFVYCGFRPRFIMIKRSDGVTNWLTEDTSRSIYNVTAQALYPNVSVAEDTSGPLDILSNGFKPRSGVDTLINASGGTYIYAAFAENPFNSSRAR